MKLLLTSAGLTNQELKKTFISLLTKNSEENTVVFITTASNPEKNKNYVGEDVNNLKQTGINNILPIDVADKNKHEWIDKLQKADVIWVEGGNTYYLLDQFRKSGLINNFKEIIGDKLYVGVSAGSILVTPTIAISGVEPADFNIVNLKDLTGLSWVDFEVSPHTPDVVPYANVETYAKTSNLKIYAYDDGTGILVSEDKVEVVGKKNYKVFNKK